MIVLLDMDDVLVDFSTAACEVHGLTREQVEHYRVPGVWELEVPTGLAKTAGMCGMTLDEWWEPIHKAGSDFWESLDRLPWFDDVVGWAETNYDEWYICTAGCNGVNSYGAKVSWLKREFGSKFDRFIMTPHKELLANPSRVLVDDKEANVERFRSFGGQALLFPSKGNSAYESANKPMELLGWV